jgi:hypothetical protein
MVRKKLKLGHGFESLGMELIACKTDDFKQGGSPYNSEVPLIIQNNYNSHETPETSRKNFAEQIRDFYVQMKGSGITA